MALTASNSSRERGIGIGLVGTPLDTFRNLQSTSRSSDSQAGSGNVRRTRYLLLFSINR